MYKILIAILIAIFVGVAGGTPVDASDEYTPEMYKADRVCFVDTDQGNTIAVLDNWELLDEPTVGSGLTSQFFRVCIPVVCPDGYTLVSTVCWESDPFDHIPYESDVVTIDEPSATEELLIDVGPLIEPAIPNGGFIDILDV